MKQFLCLVLFIFLIASVSSKADVYTYRDKSGRLVLTDAPKNFRRSPKKKRRVSTQHTTAPQGLPLAAKDEEINQLISKYAGKFNIEKKLLHAVVSAESDYDKNAVSNKGAMGLMQLMPETGKEYGVHNFFDAEENISAGAKHLKALLDRYFGDYEMALAAYNAGPTVVDKYNGIPPYPETQAYVSKIMKMVRGTNYQSSTSASSAHRSTIYRYVDENGHICLTNIYPSSADRVEVVRK